MKAWIALACIVLVGICLYFFFATSVTNAPAKNDTIILFGDSLAFGYGATKGNDMASQLSRKLQKPVINMGVNGNTTGDGLARLNLVLAQNPGIVIISLGGNDFLRKIDRTTTQTNLEQIITRLQDSGAVVILLGVRDQALFDGALDMFDELSEMYKTGYVPNILAGLVGDRRYMFDAVHPNDTGYARIVERLYPLVIDLGYERPE